MEWSQSRNSPARNDQTARRFDSRVMLWFPNPSRPLTDRLAFHAACSDRTLPCLPLPRDTDDDGNWTEVVREGDVEGEVFDDGAWEDKRPVLTRLDRSNTGGADVGSGRTSALSNLT